MHKLFAVFFIALIIAGCGNPLAGTNTGFLPVDGDYPGLHADGKRKTFLLEGDRDKYLGNNSVIFENYGLIDFFHNTYTLNGSENYLSIESYHLTGDNGAAGVFYYFVRRKLMTKGKSVDVGSDGVLDVKNDGRNLYFFKGRWFFAVIYSGKGEVPDLLPIARMIAAKVPGNNWKPRGFRYLEVDGISSKYAYVSAGNAMNFAFLPPSATTFVSSVGMKSNIYVSTFADENDADKAAEEYRGFLRMGENYKTVSVPVDGKSYQLHQAIDEKEGLLMFMLYRKAIISISHVENAELAQTLFERVIRKIKADTAG